jgi:hypothetical protein
MVHGECGHTVSIDRHSSSASYDFLFLRLSVIRSSLAFGLPKTDSAAGKEGELTALDTMNKSDMNASKELPNLSTDFSL